MNLAEKLISLRKQKGLTQLELAERLNVSRQAISRWEVGTAVPGTDNLKFLSELYGVSVDYLLNDNADISYNIAEKQLQTQERLPTEGTKKKLCIIFIYALSTILAIVIGILIWRISSPRDEKTKVTSIEDIIDVVEDDYPVETFYLNPID